MQRTDRSLIEWRLYEFKILARLLLAEGIPEEDVAIHPDWRLWLWTPSRVAEALRAFSGNGRAASA